MYLVSVAYIAKTFAPVAQLDRATDFYSVGWGFESLRVRHQFHHARYHNMKLHEIIAAVSAKRREYLAQPGIRRGQALFNAVAAVVPIYAERNNKRRTK